MQQNLPVQTPQRESQTTEPRWRPLRLTAFGVALALVLTKPGAMIWAAEIRPGVWIEVHGIPLTTTQGAPCVKYFGALQAVESLASIHTDVHRTADAALRDLVADPRTLAVVNDDPDPAFWADRCPPLVAGGQGRTSGELLDLARTSWSLVWKGLLLLGGFLGIGYLIQLAAVVAVAVIR